MPKVLIVGELSFASSIPPIVSKKLQKEGSILIDPDPNPAIRRYVDELEVVIVDAMMPDAQDKVEKIREEFAGPIYVAFGIKVMEQNFTSSGAQGLIDTWDVPKTVRQLLRKG